MRDAAREQHRRTLRQALHVWLDQYPEDFAEPPNFPCMSQLETFTARVMPESELDGKVRRLGTALRRAGASPTSARRHPHHHPRRPLPRPPGPERGPSSLRSTPLIDQLLSTGDFNVKSPPSANPAPTSAATTAHALRAASPRRTAAVSPSGRHGQYHFTNLLPGRGSGGPGQHGASPSSQGVVPPYSDFLEIPERAFAEQLTRMDYVSQTDMCLTHTLV